MSAERGTAVVSDSRHAGLVFALPWLLGLIGLTIVPAVASLLLSFARWDGLSLMEGIEWVGTSHYRELLSSAPDGTGDPLFHKALGNSLYYTFFAVPLGLIASLGVAMLLNSRVTGIGWFRILFYLPHLLGGVATVLIWGWLFNPQFGPINAAIQGFYTIVDPVVRWIGGSGTAEWPTPDWFYSPGACKPALVIMHLWLGGGSMLIFLATLQRVPHTLHEAAALEGAGALRRFWHITLVHISPAILFNALVGVIFAMQSFDHAYLLHNRAQEDGLLFYMLQLYRVAFEPPYRMGYASAMAWILFAVIAVLTIPILLSARWWVYYEADQ